MGIFERDCARVGGGSLATAAMMRQQGGSIGATKSGGEECCEQGLMLMCGQRRNQACDIAYGRTALEATHGAVAFFGEI